MANASNPMAQTILHTPRLILRPIQIEDAGDVLAIRSQEAVWKWLWSRCTVQSEAEEWIENIWASPYGFCFAIELTPAERAKSPTSRSAQGPTRIIGTCGGRKPPSLGYSFHPDYWGHGYATETLRAVIDRYWQVWPEGCPLLDEQDQQQQQQEEEKQLLQRRAITADTFAANLASENVLRKLGFESYGEREDDTFRGREKIKLWRKWGPGIHQKSDA